MSCRCDYVERGLGVVDGHVRVFAGGGFVGEAIVGEGGLAHPQASLWTPHDFPTTATLLGRGVVIVPM